MYNYSDRLGLSLSGRPGPTPAGDHKGPPLHTLPPSPLRTVGHLSVGERCSFGERRRITFCLMMRVVNKLSLLFLFMERGIVVVSGDCSLSISGLLGRWRLICRGMESGGIVCWRRQELLTIRKQYMRL